MKSIYKKLTYKALFSYSLVVIALLIVAVPVFATTNPTGKLLDFSFSTRNGTSPADARLLSPGINVDNLNPGEEHWYTYNRNNFDNAELAWVSLALRYQSEAIIETEQVNFEVLSQEIDTWFQKATSPQAVLGAGLRSPLQTANPSLTESFWTGRLNEQESYYVRVFNNSPFALGYTLEAKTEQPTLSQATPASFNAASGPAGSGASSGAIGNLDVLNTRQTAWTLTAMAIENMPAGEAAIWMQQAQEVGWIITDGTSPENVPTPSLADPQTLWALTAQAIEGQDAEAAARWLIQADQMGWLSIPPQSVKRPPVRVENEEAGGGEGGGNPPPAEPIPPREEYVPVNVYPNHPLDLNLQDVNSGRLAPYGEHWYSFTRDDLDEDLIEDMKMTMFFTPRSGYMSHRVNFELFPAGEYHIWERGDADFMRNFGDGAWVSRDEDPHTGERLWSGSLVDGDRYLVKVKNGTDEVIDYYLFPNDVENAELGNPILHQAAEFAGRVSAVLSPPTKPAAPPQPGAGPPEAIPLKIGTTEGKLDPGEEIWYKFYYSDSYNETTPEHDFKFYLTNTPLDNIRARHADFAIYPGGQLHLWTRGTTDQLKPLGTGSSSPNITKDVRSLQVVWDGQLMEEQTYYVKVYNRDIGPLEYELDIQGGP